MNAVWIDDTPEAGAPSNSLKIERETHKLEKRLCRQVGQAIVDYNMIEEGDKVMVCVSGGKDSYALLDILLKMKARAPIHFDIVAVNLDQKQPGFPEEVLPKYLSELGVADENGDKAFDTPAFDLLSQAPSALRIVQG